MRLIDADELIRKAIKFYTTNYYNHITDMIEKAPTIKTKEIKYYDESENVWKIGRVIVDE